MDNRLDDEVKASTPPINRENDQGPETPVRSSMLRSQITLAPASLVILSSLLNAALVFNLFVLPVVQFYPAPATTYAIERTLHPRAERRLILRDNSGRKFAERGACIDAPVSRSDVPDHLVDALLAMEDRRFYSHWGFDPKGIARAAVRNVKAGRIAEGGSTITQQLAKLAYLSHVRSWERKLDEVLIALRLEIALTKDQILERYLNAAYFGSGCHGLRAAARHYFGASVNDLTVAQSAFLVALLKAPSTLSQDLDEAFERQQIVLHAMVETGRLTEAERKTIKPIRIRKEKESAVGGYYADWVAQTIELPDDGQTAPLAVRTSFEPALQNIAESAVEKVLKRSGKRRNVDQAAVVVMRPDGRVLAMVGGRHFRESRFNRAFHAQRQPGSAFKTFVYLAALRQGAKPSLYIQDSPISIGDWEPKNFGKSFSGAVSLEKAFANSINTVAVRLSEAAGRNAVISAARDLGIETEMRDTPSLALGTSELNLVELTSAYAAIAAEAYPVRPWSVVSLNGSHEQPRPPVGAGAWALTEAPELKKLLSATVRQGTATGARLRIPAYGKTGTSQDYRDAWFVGFSGNLVVGVWTGNDDNSPMRNVTGGSLPVQIWREIVRKGRKVDPEFVRQPGKIAAFEAKPRKDTFDTTTELASLMTNAPAAGLVAGWRMEQSRQLVEEQRRNRYRVYRDERKKRHRRHIRAIIRGDSGA